MGPKSVSLPLVLVILAAVIAGCTSITEPNPPATILTPEPVTSLTTVVPVTSLPSGEIARIRVDHFGMNPSTETVYEFVGSLHMSGGPWQSVQVTLKYPDGQEYPADLGGMGGANATIKSFTIFPADRYKGTNPEKIISLDGRQYGTTYRYENGNIFWIATPATALPS